jgi:hypothetical protein
MDFIGSAHVIWKQTVKLDTSTVFEKSLQLLKSKAYIKSAIQSAFVDRAVIGSPSKLWMQSYYSKPGTLTSGITDIMVHTSRPRNVADEHAINTALTVVLAMLKLCEEAFGACPHTSLEVILILSDKKKKLPTDLKLGVGNVNSGFSSQNKVVVFRLEECHKVLIHELLHFWGAFANRFPPLPADIPPGTLLTETIVETLATIITCAFSVGSVSEVGSRIKHEISHSAIVAQRVSNCDAGKTNAWAYFVGRAWLMHNLNAFIVWFEKERIVRTPEKWLDVIALMQDGKLNLPPVTANLRVTGLIRMVDCEPDVRWVPDP